MPILKPAFFPFKTVLEWWICTFFDEVFLQKITLMWRRWGTSQNFLLAFIDELWKTQKIRILKKWKKKKNCWRYHHFTHVYQKPQSYEVQFLRYGVRQFFLVIFGHFLPLFSPLPNNPENQNFEKMKKASGDVIILNLCNKKHNHMMYAYSDMECDDIIFCYFRLFFCSFTPLLTPKIKIWKKCKKHLEILSFYTCVP